MPVILVTGASGLIGSETVAFFVEKGFKVVGIDNDMRAYFFGAGGSTYWNRDRLKNQFSEYEHYDIDIRDINKLEDIYRKFQKDIGFVVHTAAQPSHDWAATEPLTDFSINASATLNLLELTRKYCSEAGFIFTSTNKVYGDTPNFLPLIEKDTRWEIGTDHVFFDGIDETMSIDQSKHSLFGVSKTAADLLVQEYGRYFGMKTACFRGGCLTGPHHSGTELHGFLSYLMKCCVENRVYKIFGYKGKQVRDNIHAHDLVNAFWHFYQDPGKGEVYNIGGGRENSCSILEAIQICEKISGKKLQAEYVEANRSGDHIWYISSLKKFQRDYPDWKITIDLEMTLRQIYERVTSNE